MIEGLYKKLLRNKWRMVTIGLVLALFLVAALEIYKIIGRQVLTEFTAACRDYNLFPPYDTDDLHFVEGPYSGEFWREIILYQQSKWRLGTPDPQKIENGRFYVTWSFNWPIVPPTGKWGGEEPEENAFYITRNVAAGLLKRRIEEGADVSAFKDPELIKRWQRLNSGNRSILPAHTCGVIESLILEDGALARP